MAARETETDVVERPEKPVPIRWKAVEWDLFEAAAEEFGKQQHMPKTTPTDVIRSGALRRAEEILGPERTAEILGITAGAQ